MGIPLLSKIIKKYAINTIKETSIKDYKNKVFVIDTNLLIYKNVFAIRKNGYDIRNDNIIVTHIYSLLLKLIGLKKYNIFSIFVFDGHMPRIKQETVKARKKLRQIFKKKYDEAKTIKEKQQYFYLKSDITDKEINDCKKLIKIFGFPIYQSKGEADIDLAAFSINNKNIYIVSDDMDILAFGGKHIIRKFTISSSKKMIEINLNNLLNKLELNIDMFINLVILLGCDYCKKQKNIGPLTAYKLIKNNNIKNINKKVKKYYLSVKPNTTHNLSNYKEYNINKKELIKFLKKNKFQVDLIIKKMILIL